MKRFITFIFVLIILGGIGFGVYWFAFRDASDGGDLTNKEVLFAIQSVLKDQNVDLDKIVEIHQEVSFATPKTADVVSAEQGSAIIGQEFDALLTETEDALSSLTSEQFNSTYSAPLIFAYSALYQNVFGGENFKQGVWYKQGYSIKIDAENSLEKIYQIKILSKGKYGIYIWFYDQNEKVFNEMFLNFNFRNEKNVYSLENKIVKTNTKAIGVGENSKDSYTYQYVFFNRNADKVLNYDDVKFTSAVRYDRIVKTYSFIDFNINSIYNASSETIKKYNSTTTLSTENKNEIIKYMVGNLDVNFYELDKYAQLNSANTATLTNACKYFN